MIGVPNGVWPQYLDIAEWGRASDASVPFQGRREMTRLLIEETKWKNPIRVLLQIFRKHLDGYDCRSRI